MTKTITHCLRFILLLYFVAVFGSRCYASWETPKEKKQQQYHQRQLRWMENKLERQMTDQQQQQEKRLKELEKRLQVQKSHVYLAIALWAFTTSFVLIMFAVTTKRKRKQKEST